MKKNTGISKLHIKLDKPSIFSGFKIEDMNSLSIFIGANGTGKSMILVLTWCINMVVNLYHNYRFITEADFHKLSSNIFKWSFKDLNLNGTIEAQYFGDADNLVQIEFVKGDIVSCKIGGLTIPSSSPIFMSKQTRTYSDINKYFTIKKSLAPSLMKITSITLRSFFKPCKELQALLEIYRVYDIIFMEELSKRLIMPHKIDPEISKKYFTSDLAKSIMYIKFDLYSRKFVGYTKFGDSKVDLEMLSAGEQSLLNMLSTTKTL